MYFSINGKNVKSLDYNIQDRTLKVLFQNGRTYQYEDVGASWVARMIGSEADSLPREIGKTHKYVEIK